MTTDALRQDVHVPEAMPQTSHMSWCTYVHMCFQARMSDESQLAPHPGLYGSK